jgi:hypothetical protein
MFYVSSLLYLVLGAFSITAAPVPNNSNELFDWVRAMGGFVDPRLELSTGPDPAWNVRGVFATAPIAEGEELARVPADAQICHPDMCGLIRLLRDELSKKADSKYWPYIKTMATHEIDYPNVWTDEERGLLVGLQPTDWTRHTEWFETECWPALREEKQASTNRHDILSPDPLTWRALHLYVARITSVLGRNCFVPIYDAMNHRNGPEQNTAWSSHNTRHVHIRVTQSIVAGQQLWNSFGNGAGRMLRDYGFIEQNPSDWSIEENGITCAWTLTEQDELDWEESPEQCLSMLQKHMSSVRPMPDPTPTMRPTRVAMARQYRENYITSLRMAINSLSREL